jgi:hypothetical protein
MDVESRLRWIFERLNEGDVASLVPFWTEATVDYFPHAEIRGPRDLEAWFSSLIAAAPDVHWDVKTIVTEGDIGFVRWHLTGTFTGESILGFAATGSKFALDGMDNFVFEDGTIKTAHVVYDQLAFARQIGMIPDDGTLADRIGKAAFNALTKLKRLFGR